MNVVSYETNISKSSRGQQQGRAAHGGTTLRASIMQGMDAGSRTTAIPSRGDRAFWAVYSVALNNRHKIGIGRVFTFRHISTGAIKWCV